MKKPIIVFLCILTVFFAGCDKFDAGFIVREYTVEKCSGKNLSSNIRELLSTNGFKVSNIKVGYCNEVIPLDYYYQYSTFNGVSQTVGFLSTGNCSFNLGVDFISEACLKDGPMGDKGTCKKRVDNKILMLDDLSKMIVLKIYHSSVESAKTNVFNSLEAGLKNYCN